MIHVYKLGGQWIFDDIEYTIKTINQEHLAEHLNDDWVTSFDELKCQKESLKKSSSKSKKLGDKSSVRASIETLEKQIKAVKNGSDS